MSDQAISVVLMLAAGHFGVDIDDIIAGRPRGPRKVPRYVAYYLASVGLNRSRNSVASAFGRHHSTIDHALRCVEDWRDDPVFDARLQRLEARLQAA